MGGSGTSGKWELATHQPPISPGYRRGPRRGGPSPPTIGSQVSERSFTEARLLTVNEVADLLRVSRMTVYRLIKEGDIAALRVGRSYRLREDDVDDYLSERYTVAG